MNIVIVYNGIIPVTLYGGTERVIWYLGEVLHEMGHHVTYLVEKGSYCPFGDVIYRNPTLPLKDQIPVTTDIVHFNGNYDDTIKQPYVVTEHGNRKSDYRFAQNTIFVSSNHAERYNAQSFVYNGLNWDDYQQPNWNTKRQFYHFLGKAAWRVKNVKGAIKVIHTLKDEQLYVLGGSRLNFKMGFRLTLSPKIHFKGMVGGREKESLLNQSKGLIFPVRWHEPFGLAITESLFYGCPVFGTPYGSLPELVTPEVGFLSTSHSEIAENINHHQYNPMVAHEYASELFNSRVMAKAYLKKYENVLNGQTLNSDTPKLKEVTTEKFLEWK